jgi:hypothetical protein
MVIPDRGAVVVVVVDASVEDQASGIETPQSAQIADAALKGIAKN